MGWYRELKRAARDRQARTGETYSTARMHVYRAAGRCYGCKRLVDDHAEDCHLKDRDPEARGSPDPPGPVQR